MSLFISSILSRRDEGAEERREDGEKITSGRAMGTTMTPIGRVSIPSPGGRGKSAEGAKGEGRMARGLWMLERGVLRNHRD
jgi:hypothetical protein